MFTSLSGTSIAAELIFISSLEKEKLLAQAISNFLPCCLGDEYCRATTTLSFLLCSSLFAFSTAVKVQCCLVSVKHSSPIINACQDEGVPDLESRELLS